MILSQVSALRSLKYLIVYDDIPDSYKQKASNNGIKVLTLDQIVKSGIDKPLSSNVSFLKF